VVGMGRIQGGSRDTYEIERKEKFGRVYIP
jgi:hypothetical protein